MRIEQKDKMADASQSKTTSNSIAVSSSVGATNPVISTQSAQQTTASGNTQAGLQQDTKVRTAGTSLAEFLGQLDDYTPTVSFNTCNHFSILKIG